MRFNTHGIIGLFAITGMAAVALSRRGSYIPAVVLLIVLYGTVLLKASIATETESRLPSSHFYPEPRGRVIGLAHTWLIALHVAFMLTLGTFLLGLQNAPFVNLGLTPLAVLVSFCLVGLTLTATAEGVRLNARMVGAVIPVVVLISVAAFVNWGPLWYPHVALALYCYLLILRTEKSHPWKGHRPRAATVRPRIEGALLFHSPPQAMNDRKQLGIYSSLVLVSMGLLIDVTDIRAPNWWAWLFAFNGSHDASYQTALRIFVFLGCEIIGLVIPFLLLSEQKFR
jgi:hypothetical protein